MVTDHTSEHMKYEEQWGKLSVLYLGAKGASHQSLQAPNGGDEKMVSGSS